MTREVAIEGLKAFRKEFSGYEPNEEMFDMAIKALEQEPRKDEVILTKEEYGELVSSEFDNGYAKGYREALEQEPTTKNDLGVDCISRADALDCVNWGYSFSDIYKKINELPSVTPQEPFINKLCVSSGVCEHDKNKVLDKIDEIITDALDKSTDQKESQTLRWVLDKISEVT